MRLTEIDYPASDPVDGYGPGFFRIGGQVWQGAMLTGPRGTGSWGGFDDSAPLLALSEAVDVLFIGTGGDVAHLPPALTTVIEEAGMGVESMTSPAACRTYNVLLAEGRRVALAVLPIAAA